MIKHIVMWKLKNEALNKNKTENALEMKKQLEELKNKIQELVTIEVGINQLINEQAFDVVLLTEFKTKADLNHYQVHPEHLKVVKFIKQVVDKRIFVDYEI